jgi:hypothetical protein
MKITAKIDIDNCECCIYHKSYKVYTSDSFENVRKVHCTKLNKDVHSYLDWHEDAKIPKECPFRSV